MRVNCSFPIRASNSVSVSRANLVKKTSFNFFVSLFFSNDRLRSAKSRSFLNILTTFYAAKRVERRVNGG